MRPASIQKRKNRVIYKKLLLSFGIFLISLLACVLIFGWQYLRSAEITSPLGHIKTAVSTNPDAAVYTVKLFCEEEKIPCQDITQSNGAVTITLDNNAIILLSSQKDIQKQLASLQLTLSQLTIEGKQFKKLDFRFDKPFATF